MNHFLKNYQSLEFVSLLRSKRIETALNKYTNSQKIALSHNGKSRVIKTNIWLRYLKKNLLSTTTDIIQFDISNIESYDRKNAFKVHMICRTFDGLLFLTEIDVESFWEKMQITKINYNIRNY